MPTSLTGRGALTIIRQCSKSIGVTLPPEIAEQLTKADQLIAKADSISGAALSTAVLDALAENRDYHSDKAVLKLLLDKVLVDASIGFAARSRAGADLEDTITQHADAVLSAWSTALEPHSQHTRRRSTDLARRPRQRRPDSSCRR